MHISLQAWNVGLTLRRSCSYFGQGYHIAENQLGRIVKLCRRSHSGDLGSCQAIDGSADRIVAVLQHGIVCGWFSIGRPAGLDG